MALTFNQVKPTTISQEQVPAPKNETGMANITIRVDADCFLLCDGEFMEEIEIVANQITKAQLPIGQHILEFIDATNPDVKLEKEVDFPEDGKNYLVLIKGLQEAGSKAKENAAKAEAEKQMHLEAERKAKEEAVRKAKEEAARKAKEEAVRKAKEEAECKAKQKTIEVKVTDISSQPGFHENTTTILVGCIFENRGRISKFDIELVIIDILTSKKYTLSTSETPNFFDNFVIGINNKSLPSKFKCQAIVRYKNKVLATSEFYDLVRK